MPRPVLILALDTTTRTGSAAVLSDDEVLAVAEGNGERTHGERLPGELAQVLAHAHLTLDSLDLLAVASGPGAFTGLRIGLAAMQGLALVTGRPVVGVSALDALAAEAFQGLGIDRARIGSWMDAARGEVFAALYDAEGQAGDVPVLTAIAPPEVESPARIWSAWRPHATSGLTLTGDGAVRYAAGVGADVRVLPHPLLAPAIARLARRLHTRGGPHTPHELQPLYIRRPDAERGPAKGNGISEKRDLVPRVELLAGPADLDAVLAIEEASFTNPTTRAWYEAELARPDVCTVLVLRTREASVAGFAAFWRVQDEMHINNLAVHPTWRGCGLGRVLVAGVLAHGRDRGVRRATLEVRRSNALALRLYEAAGFAVVGVRRDYYAQPVEDALVLAAAVESP